MSMWDELLTDFPDVPANEGRESFGHEPVAVNPGYCGGCETCGSTYEQVICGRCSADVSHREGRAMVVEWPCWSAVVLGLVPRELEGGPAARVAVGVLHVASQSGSVVPASKTQATRGHAMDHAPDFICKDTYTGTSRTSARASKSRVTEWLARELADLAPSGALFVSIGHVNGEERFVRYRYVAEASGSLVFYDAWGARYWSDPADRKVRILTK